MKKLILLLAVLMPFWAYSQDEFVSKETAKRNALLEEGTGVHCGNCPRAHAAINNLMATYGADRILPVNIHSSSLAEPYSGDYDLRTPEGEDFLNYFKINSFPTFMVNRSDKRYSAMWDEDYEEYISSVLQEDAVVNIAARAELNWRTRKLALRVQLYYPAAVSASAHYLHVAMVQDSIITQHSNYNYSNPAQELEDGKYLNLHTYRCMADGTQWDEGIAFEPAQGQVIEQTLEFTVPYALYHIPAFLANLHFVCFVTETPADNVLNACHTEIENNVNNDYILEVSNVKANVTGSCNAETFFDFDVTNVKGETLNSITFALPGVNCGVTEYKHELSTPLAVGQTAHVTTPYFPLVEFNNDLFVTVYALKVNDKEYFYNDASSAAWLTTRKNHVLIPESEVSLNIVQDRYGSDITWNVKDMAGALIAQGGPYEDLPDAIGTELHRHPLSLEKAKGCYLLTVNDAHNDGINSQFGHGFINMENGEGREFYFNDGKYGSGFTLMLDTRSVSNARMNRPADFTAYPNPAHGTLNVEAEGEFSAALYNLSGAEVLAPAAFTNKGQLNVANLPAGLYLLQVRTPRATATAKVLLK